ncbi:MAG TPA: SRPBCC domain-containing protein [Polyangiaceae bacterium]|nr:SRPBCC domain-containing protein [Polyangiaceae bacterium]
MTQKQGAGRASITTPSAREIRVERIFNASRERVWRAITDPALVRQWWGRGNHLVVERFEVERGGHWRFVEHSPQGVHGFEGRYREVVPPERIVQTFEWDGMPGFVAVETMTLEALDDERTRLVSVSLFHTTEERDGMLHSGMEVGMNQSYAALDRVLESLDASEESARGAALAVKKVAFSCYPILDAARARKFYEETLGLKVGMAGSKGDTHWIEYDLPGGGCLALTNAGGGKPSAEAGGTIALEVTDLGGWIDHLKARGVTFKSDVIKGPHCRMAVCLDSEGNSLLLHQLDAQHASGFQQGCAESTG